MFYLFIAIALLAPLIHFLSKRSKNSIVLNKLFLLYGLLSLTGLSGFYSYSGHTFVPNQVAAYIGWPPGSPFQFEVACANLAFGVLGLMCLWRGVDFWLATILGQGVFLWGAAYGHIQDITLHHNYAPGNAGIVLYLDILVPVYLLSLLIMYLYQLKQKTAGFR